jgi:hypothetical protein
MKASHSILLPLLLALALTGGACDNSSSSNLPSIPATPTPVSETFEGTVPLLDTHDGADFRPFTVAVSGAVTVTLTAASPPPTIQMGVGVGTPTGTTCTIIPNGSATVAAGTPLSGTLTVGTYCVEIFDVGNMASPVTYSVTVVHS